MNPARSHARDKVASPEDLGGATSYGMNNPKLNNYVEQARKSGMTDAKIRKSLLQFGWRADDVDKAMVKALDMDAPLHKFNGTLILVAPETDQSLVENKNLEVSSSPASIPNHKSPDHWFVVAVTIVAVVGFLVLSFRNGFWPFGDLITPLSPMSQPVKLDDLGPPPGSIE